MLRYFFVVLLCFISCSFIKPKPAVEPPLVKPAFVHFIFRGEVNPQTAEQLVNGIKTANRQNIPILLEIDSEGGEYDSGWLIVKAIEASHVKMVCLVDGNAFSMASYILESCPTRLMTKRSLIMIHGPVFVPNEDLTPEQKAEVIRKTTVFTAARKLAMAEQYAARMNLTPEAIIKKIDNDTDWFLSWTEAFSTGAVDGVVTKPSKALETLLQR